MDFYLGDHSIKFTESSQRSFEADRVIVHPDYAIHPVMGHDLALIRLTDLIEYSDEIQPVCLPSEDIPDGHTCVATGWGDTAGKVACGLSVLTRIMT